MVNQDKRNFLKGTTALGIITLLEACGYKGASLQRQSQLRPSIEQPKFTGPAKELTDMVSGYDNKPSDEKLAVEEAVYNHFKYNSQSYEFAIAAKVYRTDDSMRTLGVRDRITLHWDQMAYLVDGALFKKLVKDESYEAPKGNVVKKETEVSDLVIPANTVTKYDLVRMAKKLGTEFRVTMTKEQAKEVWVNFNPEVFIYGLRLREDADAIPGLQYLNERYRGKIPLSQISYAGLTDNKRLNLELVPTGNHVGIQVYTHRVPL